MKKFVYLVLLLALLGGAFFWFMDDRNDSQTKASSQRLPEQSTRTEQENLSSTPMTSPASQSAGSDAAGAEAADAALQTGADADGYSAAAAQQDYSRLQPRIDAMQQRRPGTTYDPQEVAEAMQQKTAWNPVDEAPVSLPLKPEEFTDGRQFIELNPLKMETLMPGDEMTVVIEKLGAEYVVKIDSVEVHDSERVSWFGHLAGLDERYSVSFTRGPSLTVGGLDTPEGHYVLQAHGKDGWIASSQLLFKFNTEESDAIVPPGHEHDH